MQWIRVINWNPTPSSNGKIDDNASIFGRTGNGMNKCHTQVLQNVDPTWNQDIIRTINQLYCEPHSELSIQELVKISSDTWEYWLEPILGEVQMIMQLLMTQIKIVTLMSIFNFHVHYTHIVECIKKISTSNSLFLHNWCSWSVKVIRSSDKLKKWHFKFSI